MTTEQNAITKAIIQVVMDATKAVVQEVKVARAEAYTGNRNKPASRRPETGRPSLK